MYSHKRGMVLLTTLILMGFILAMVIHSYETILIQQKLLNNTWQITKQQAEIDAIAENIAKNTSMPIIKTIQSGVREQTSHLKNYVYQLSPVKTAHCSVIQENKLWLDADIFQLRIWQPGACVVDVYRLVKPTSHRLCENPWNYYQHPIISKVRSLVKACKN